MVQEYSVAPSKPGVTKVRRITKRRNLQAASLVVLMVTLFGLGLLSVFVRCQVAVLGYKIVQLKQEVADLDQENRRLELRIAELSSPSRIETLAVTQLGMCKPDKMQTVALKEQTPPATVIANSHREDSEGVAENRERPMEKLYRAIVRLGSTASKKTLGMMD